ncbi:FAD-dependent 5-carboxymethylaminomethyl-2-thiouridine(34) oxidoreductase MnmC [Roseateles asaccharophilus]|uniref:tRNA 5-methylaminomethyl-2-thiouridine biosynthesis bifunctional protein MnmC n=1 Tax=Roseateles asaccharophilus TaxID=582607 RepID=A0ABU2AA44_9BURK|nr:FAD-dependent 5-carboxymethylaminomethyl-2-thiouridine(34) oxidoreductase MnmC [Roseateles asaccharophilus]MDR7334073.1 tRNA 5-methylaminomethyl-2-thiouridine biosynthesis bifunctional protein [Roseateles asaccharophilus]
MKIAPAEVDFSDPTAPASPAYGDVYHSRAGALAQARHVFLGGNGLPGRWQGRQRFVVLETGFGLGNNFLATWDAWRQDPARCERLVFVSVEKHPLRPDDLARAHAASPLPELAQQLVDRWPPLTAGLHTLGFEDGRVELLLGLGDARELLRQLVLQADAIYLDGFSPKLNPELWDEWLLKSLARHAVPGTTIATWSINRPMRRALASLGFEVGLAPGFASKPEMTTARFAPRHLPQRPAGREPLARDAKQALIIGAGLAGAACALSLAREGVACTVVDALGAPAQASSGNPAGLFHGTLNPDDGPHARFNRAAALATQAMLRDLCLPQQPGLLRLETRLAIDAMAGVPGYVEPLSAEAASARAGATLPHPAWFYPGGGAVDPAAYVRAMLQASGATLRLQTRVAALRRDGDGWTLLDASGAPIASALLVVLAGGHAQLPLLGELANDLTVQRGQLTHLAQAPWCPGHPIAGDGYAIADGQGGAWCGATTQDGDLDPTLRAADQIENLTRYARLAGLHGVPDAPLAGRVAWRLISPDRLPLIGGLPAPDAPLADQLRLQPRAHGLVVCTGFASRGITWAALAGRLVAALALGAPRPLEADLVDAVDPLRFTLRRQRRPTR